jgi:phosphatidylglycerophosphate synthase
MTELAAERAYAVTLMAAVAISALVFAVRVTSLGMPRFDRVEKIGGSAILAKPLVAWWYWCMQPLARACVALGLTANAVSWLSLFLGLASGVAIAFGRLGLATVLGVAGNLCDAVDGMVARLRNESSDAGEVLDAAIDRYTDFFMVGGLVVLWRHDVALLSIALAALLGSFMISYSTAKAEALRVEPPRGLMRRHERSAYLLCGIGVSAALGPTLLAHALMPALPLIAALSVVAVVSNTSAIKRLVTIGDRVRARSVATRSTAPLRADQPGE